MMFVWCLLVVISAYLAVLCVLSTLCGKKLHFWSNTQHSQFRGKNAETFMCWIAKTWRWACAQWSVGQNEMWTTRGTARSHVYRTGFAKNQHEYCILWAETQALCLSRPSQWLTIIKSSEKRLYILFYTFFYIDVTGTSHATATSCDSQVACVPYGIC